MINSNKKLEIKNLCVNIKGSRILDDLSFEIQGGEFMSLLGPSGCGKSTLLKTIAGIIPIENGEIYLDGKDISSVPAYKRGAVIVFQDLRLFPHITVEENVAFPLKMQGKSKKERLSEAALFLEKVKLSGCGTRKVSQISGGQQQRVALARALAARPDLILLDEPFSSLDENLREEMQELILSLHRELNMTTVMVTHDRSEAFKMSDRVAVMFSGRIHQTGTPSDVCSAPADIQVSQYLGKYLK